MGSALFGLRPVAPAGDRFDEDRVGLDHLSFAVDSVADLEEMARTLDGLGVAHGGVKDIGLAHILEFRDPDNIALELFAWKPRTGCPNRPDRLIRPAGSVARPAGRRRTVMACPDGRAS